MCRGRVADPTCMRPRARISGEAGAVLTEVMVSAVLLVVLAVGLYPMFDGSAQAGADARTRAVATSVAGDAIEQMRAMPMSTLGFYANTSQKTVRGITYTITSKADWMRDSTGDVTCTLNTTGVEYLRLRATVTAPGMDRPIRVDSLITPPAGAFDPTSGSLIVYTKDAAGQPLSGVTVNAGGRSGVSGSDGCVVLIMLPGGDTTVTASATGLSTVDLQPSASVTATVVTGQTSSVTVQLDRLATANISFDTIAKAGQAAVATTATAVSAATPPLAAPVVKTISPAASSTSMQLFPFPDGYGLYAGSCPGNDPTQYSLAANLLTTAPAATVSKTVRVPSLWIRTQRSTGTAFAAPTVVITPNTGDARMNGCTGRWALAANASGDVITALPVGAYAVCAADSNGYRATGTVINDAVTGDATPAVTLTVPSSGFSHPGCP